MKKIILVLLMLFLPVNYLAYDITDKLIIDINIRDDGSIHVKELASLYGDYNGRIRSIYYKNSNAPKFTGKYEDFAGSDIYNGSNLYDIVVGDYKGIDIDFTSFNKINKLYTKTTSSSYDYGYYNLYTKENGFEIKTYNNSNNAFYLEYKIDNVVVTHKDISEIAWNILSDSYEEFINTLEVKITLPKEDRNLRVWLFGTTDSFGEITKVDDKTAHIIYKNLEANEPVSFRLMFNNDVVVNNKKKTNINAYDDILKYSQHLADIANKEREAQQEQIKIEALENLKLAEEYKTKQTYYDALYMIDYMVTSDLKSSYLNRLKVVEDYLTNEDVKSFNILLKKIKDKKLLRDFYKAEDLVDDIITNNIRYELLEKLNEVEELVFIKQRIRTKYLLTTLLIQLGVSIYLVHKLRKDNLELSDFYIDYYREFPSDDEIPVIEYLMSSSSDSITNKSISAIILDLIYKKVIKVDQINKKDYLFTYDNKDIKLNNSENQVIDILFKTIATNDKVLLSEVTNFGKSTKNAKKLLDDINYFKSSNKKIAKQKNFFKYYFKERFMKFSILVFITLLISSISMYHLIYFIFGLSFMLLFIFASILFSMKLRTKEGVDLYKKWSAHKKFLLDFGTFDIKELPEIKLWEKYLVYATILGVASKLQKQMNLKIKDIKDPDLLTTYTRYSMLNTNLNQNLYKAIDNSLSSSIRTASNTLSPASGSGYGGGSMGSGGSFGGGSGGGRF